MNTVKYYSKSSIISWTLLTIVLLLNPPWFLWTGYYHLATVIIALLFMTIAIKKQGINARQFLWIPAALACFLFFVIFSTIYEFRFSSIITLLVFISLFFIRDEEKKNALLNLSKALAAIIIISLPFYIINAYFFPLPVFNYFHYSEGKGDGQVLLLANYIFFIQPEEDLIFRFYSVFDEPGVLGTLASFILFANRYNFKKWYNIVILIGGVFTFSLAFFFITISGLVLLNLRSFRSILLVLIFGVFVSTTIYMILKDDETFKNLILYRLENYEDRGIDSRTSQEVNKFYKSYIFTKDSVLGKGATFFKENPNLLTGQGYKLFLIEYGILGLIIVIIMYASMFNGISYVNFILLFIYFISFMQRPFMFTPWQIILFSMSVASLRSFKNEKTRQLSDNSQ